MNNAFEGFDKDTLVSMISKANTAYWENSRPIMTDVEYDQAIECLKALDPNHPLVSKVIDKVASIRGAKVTHKNQMYSLDKAYNLSDIKSWIYRSSLWNTDIILIQPKYDGLSAEVIVGEDGSVKISTRGDGQVGIDISDHAPIIRNIPTEPGVYYGELLIDLDTFYGFTDDPVMSQYTTPRNTVSGLMNADMTSLPKFPVPPVSFCLHDGSSIKHPVAGLDSKFDALIAKIRENAANWPIDGVVFKIEDSKRRSELGFTQHHPRWAIAFKFTDEQKEAIVQEIEWRVGELHVTPVARFKPIKLDGVMVSAATLHNADFVKRTGIGVGSTITVERRGGVIPKVILVKNPTDVVNIVPDKCPVCGTPLVWDGKYLNCTGTECYARIANRIIRGLNILGIQGIGPKLATRAVADLYCRDIIDWAFEVVDQSNYMGKLGPDTYTATQQYKLKSFGDILGKPVTQQNLIMSLCIPRVSNKFVTNLIDSVGNVYEWVHNVPPEEYRTRLSSSATLDADALENFVIWMEQNRDRFVKYWEGFADVAVSSPSMIPTKGVVCFTGGGPMPRKDLIVSAELSGYKVTENGNACTVLVTDNTDKMTTKLRKAKDRGIPIVSYDTFLKEYCDTKAEF